MKVARVLPLALVLGAICAGEASAATPAPTTGAAQKVTSTTATLSGSIASAGSAVTYEFQYGTSSTYGHATPPVTLSAGASTEQVSSAITGLKPGNVYHFRLAISFAGNGQGASGLSPYPVAVAGADATFTTVETNQVSLTSRTVIVKKGVGVVKLTCASSHACNGKLALAERVRSAHQRRLKSLGSGSLSIAAGKSATIEVTLNKLAIGELNATRHHRLSATLNGTFTTHQRKLSQAVTLVRA